MTYNSASSTTSAQIDAAEEVAAEMEGSTRTSMGDDRPKVSSRYIWLFVLAQFGLFMGLVAPMGFSLTVMVNRIAPDNQEFLGYVIGLGSLMVVIFGPIFGVLSDRTRSRLGRRRPWLISMTLVGMAGLTVVSLAQSIPMVAVGWTFAALGLGCAGLQLSNSLGDRLPESQRGKVAGLSGAATMVASIVGVAVAGLFASNTLLLFLVPGGIGAFFIFLFAVFVKEADSRSTTFADSITVKSLVSGYGYNVRKYADFSWNWLGRFCFNFGLTLTSTFTAFFYSSRLGLGVDELGGIIAILGVVGVVGTVGGAGLSGFLSDRLKRRKIFILAAALLFATGGVTMAVAPHFEVLLVGGFLMNFGLGIFSAVDQALYLDVMPERDTQAGRFVAINQFATSVPQFAAPVIAPIFLVIGVTGGDKNYPLLYLTASALAVIGGLIIVLRVKSAR